MSEGKMKFREFFSQILLQANIEAQVLLTEWQDSHTSETWDEITKKNLDEELLLAFTDMIVAKIRLRVATAYSGAVAYSAKIDGHQFLKKLHSLSQEFGFNIPLDRIDLPLSVNELNLRGKRQ